MKLSEKFMWGGATADFQYEGGFQEGNRGLSTHDFETAGAYQSPRISHTGCRDGSVKKARSASQIRRIFRVEESPVSVKTHIIPAIKRWISITDIKRISP